jgi:hypothetical protein
LRLARFLRAEDGVRYRAARPIEAAAADPELVFSVTRAVQFIAVWFLGSIRLQQVLHRDRELGDCGELVIGEEDDATWALQREAAVGGESLKAARPHHAASERGAEAQAM